MAPTTPLVSPQALGPLTTGEILDRMFQAYRRDFFPLWLGSTLASWPHLAFSVLVIPWHDKLAAGQLVLPPHLPWLLGLAVLAFGAMSIWSGAIVLRAGGGIAGSALEWSLVSKKLIQRVLPLFSCELFAWILFAVSLSPLLPSGYYFYLSAIKLDLSGVLLGLFALLVALCPSLILYVWLWFRDCAVLLEARTPWASLRRSLTFGRHAGAGFWEWSGTRISLILLVLLCLGVTLGTVAQLPSIWSIVTEMARTGDWSAALTASQRHKYLTLTLSMLVDALLLPLVPLARVSLFYDLKVRREAYDLELLAPLTSEA